MFQDMVAVVLVVLRTVVMGLSSTLPNNGERQFEAPINRIMKLTLTKVENSL